MPIRHRDPFMDPFTGLRQDVNPFIGKIEAAPNADIPVYVGKRLQEASTDWQQILGPGPLILEIGCHLGKNLAEMAADHPDKSFLGCDITFKRVYQAASKLSQQGSTNGATVLAPAETIDKWVAPGQLDGIVIFFPDPWQKKDRQRKHRLLNPEFIYKMKACLKIEGFIWLKTDDNSYFADARNFLNEAGFLPIQNPSSPLGQDYQSTFERRFASKGIDKSEGFWKKPQEN